MDTIEINGEKYIKASTLPSAAEMFDSMKYCIVRTYSAGVFAGYIESRNGQEVVMRQARRLWYWSGAASLSELSQSGTSDPENCKFPEKMDRVTVIQAIEIIECSAFAKASIDAVEIWKA